jgi:hypothetical protein
MGHGLLWTPLEGLAVAAGMTRQLPMFAFGQGAVGVKLVNPGAASIWLPGRTDPFREAGAWDIDANGQPTALRNNFFQLRGNHEVDLGIDYMVPFFNKMAKTIRSERSDWLVFAETDPFEAAKGRGFPEGMPERSVNASHWYDLSALVTKQFNPDRMVNVLTGEVREGPQEIEEAYTRELGKLRDVGDKLNGGSPTLIGEFGIQYDMNDAEAYRRWGTGERSPAIWHAQSTALDLMYNALDRLLASSTQWTYTATNLNDPMIGDGWNQEDLSVWSIDQTVSGDPMSGGRAVEGFSRPFVQAAQGKLLSQHFDRKSGLFEAVIDSDPTLAAPSDIFVPTVQYPAGYRLIVSESAHVEQNEQIVRIQATKAGSLTVRIERQEKST